MSSHFPNPRCDCGSCCDRCGHDRGCNVFEPPVPIPSDAQLRATAAARPDSLLAAMVAGMDRAAADAYGDPDEPWGDD